MLSGRFQQAVLAALAWFAPAEGVSAQIPLPVKPTAIGMNVPEIRYYGSTVPFANMVLGSE